MLFSKPCSYVLLFASLFSANAESIRGVEPRELDDTTDTPINLGTAGNYAILAKSGISTVPPSVITGNIAVSPIAGTAMTGFSFTATNNGKAAESVQVSGLAYAASYIAPTPSHLTTAVSDMETAYTDAASRSTSSAGTLNLGGGEIGGEILSPGVYTFGTDVTINADVTFEGTGVFIIQITNNLLMAAGKKLILANGAQANNIFWQVAGFVAVQSTAQLKGILLVKTKVDMLTGSSLDGRILAQTACTLQKATITS